MRRTVRCLRGHGPTEIGIQRTNIVIIRRRIDGTDALLSPNPAELSSRSMPNVCCAAHCGGAEKHRWGSMLSLDGDDPVAIQLRASGRRLTGVAIFSGVVNLLTLSGSLYMLQVYDRVIPSHNVATLFGLSAIVVIAYLLQGYFDALRGRMLARIGALFDVELQPLIHFALVTLPLRGTKPILVQQPLRDLDQVRAFLSGAGPTAFLDMPWMPLFLMALFLFHPAIGLVATCGAAAIIAMTLLTEWQS